ncbi:MAG: response regulator transcription factor [Chloroflexota bacterium]
MNNRPIRVLMIDDHPVVRKGIRSLISNYDQVKVIGEANDAAEGLHLLNDLKPDVILLDIRLPDQLGLDLLPTIKETDPNVKVLVLTSFDDEEYVTQALKAGAEGYILKNATDDSLIHSIQAAYKGDRVLSSAALDIVLNNLGGESPPSRHQINLDADEIKILTLLAAGAANHEVSDSLYVSSTTLKRKIRKIQEKMGVQSRVQAVAEAVRHGIV